MLAWKKLARYISNKIKFIWKILSFSFIDVEDYAALKNGKKFNLLWHNLYFKYCTIS